MNNAARELAADELWNPCNPGLFEFESTASLPGEVSIIGQERAVEAIDFGINMDALGYNIYALGGSGTGRTTTIRTLLDRAAAGKPVPDDWIYVNNFADLNRPRAISLPAGMALRFRQEMQELVSDLLREIPQAFEREDYSQRREAIIREMQSRRNEAFARLELRVNEHGFTLLKTAMGLGVAPVLNGQVLSPEAYHQLDTATQERIEASQQALQGEMAETMHTIRALDKETKRRLQAFDREVADFAVGHLVEDLKEEYGHLVGISEYLAEVHDDLVENVDGFRDHEDGGEQAAAEARARQQQELFKRYRVHILVDHSHQEGAPVVFEPNPTYGNLVGRIEHRTEMGTLVTDHTMIKAGSLHRANGGYLVLETESLLDNEAAWEALKRALKNHQIRTEEMGTQMQLVSTVTLEPAPIPLRVKVILIGDPYTYHTLYAYDPDFRKLFKVQADFGDDFERTLETCQCYAQFIAARCQQEGLEAYDREAVARVVEYGSRLAEHQKKLSTQFGEIADLVREASFWARREGRDLTTAADVEKALEKRTYRANRIEEEIQEMIDEGSLRVEIEGQAIGQVNGLSVLSLGHYSFGHPTRITTSTYTGKEGVISLDREAKLSGRLYDKGLLTLSGYLGSKYAFDMPLSLSASISFEQSYDEIDGDSASSTELYALLSSLSELPIRQGLAVTGSVDQRGNVQPVGGVNEKIEGFFDTCRRRGLDGTHGVLVPAQNVLNLMLRADVRQAVEQGEFHIYAVETVDQGIELLTGIPAGLPDEDGFYPEDSIHGRVQDRLQEITENLKESEEEEDDEEEVDDADESAPRVFRSR